MLDDSTGLRTSPNSDNSPNSHHSSHSYPYSSIFLTLEGTMAHDQHHYWGQIHSDHPKDSRPRPEHRSRRHPSRKLRGRRPVSLYLCWRELLRRTLRRPYISPSNPDQDVGPRPSHTSSLSRFSQHDSIRTTIEHSHRLTTDTKDCHGIQTVLWVSRVHEIF